MTKSSSDVADEEQFFFTQSENESESEKQPIHRKEKSWLNTKEVVGNKEPSTSRSSMKGFTKVDGNATSYSMNGIETKGRIRIEQDVDPVSINLRQKILSQTHDEVLLTTDRRYKHYKTNEDRIILKGSLLFRKHNIETGSVKNYQFLIPKHLIDEVLLSFAPTIWKAPLNLKKTTIAYRQKYYHPKMAQLLSDWFMSCEQCIRESRIDRSLIRSPLQNANKHLTAPEDATQIDLMPELSPSGGYENIVIALDVFYRYLFAYPTSNQDAKTFTQVITIIMTKHTLLPTSLISDKGSTFVS